MWRRCQHSAPRAGLESANPEGEQGGCWFLAREPCGAMWGQLPYFQDTHLGQGLPGPKATGYFYQARKATPLPERQHQHCPVKEETQLHQAG